MLLAAVLLHMSFTELPLPLGARVPDGAFRSSRSSSRAHRSLLMRSRLETPLKQQVMDLKATADIVEHELFSGAAEHERIYLNACFSDGLFTEAMYEKHKDEHPANIAGLAAAGDLLLTQRGALMNDLLGAFLSKKQRVLAALQEAYESVDCPPFFTQFNFQDEELLSEQVGAAHNWLKEPRDYLCTRLNCIRLPVLGEDGNWRLALLPNIVGASDDDVVDQRREGLRRETRAATLAKVTRASATGGGGANKGAGGEHALVSPLCSCGPAER